MEFVEHYGLIAVFFGTFAEGETVLFGAGVLAAHGMLPLGGVISVAWCGSMAGHLFWFGMGRWWGARALRTLKVTDEKIARVDGLVHRHPIASIVLLQYLYGLRLAGATILGVTRLGYVKFIVVEGINCVFWAGLVGSAGYLIGEAAAHWFHGWAKYAWIAITAMVLYLVLSRLLKSVEQRVDAEPPYRG